MVKTIEEYENDGNAAEKALIAACREGWACILNGGKLPDEGAKDAPKVRADLIRLLAVEATSLHEKGVWLEGGVITGQLDLSFAKCRGRLALGSCRFISTPMLAQTELVQLSFVGSHLPGVFAQGLRVSGDVFMRAMRATKTVNLNEAKVGGQLSCVGAHLDSAKGNALSAQGAKIAGSVVMRSITANGTVAFNSAQVGGQLSFKGATLNGPDGVALNAQGSRVRGGVFLDDTTTVGTVSVSGARIGGQLSLSQATLDGGARDAMNFQTLIVEGGLLFRKLKAVSGRVNLESARVRDLVDDGESWKRCSRLILDGFIYEQIGGNTSAKTFSDRQAWLRKGSYFGGEFRPQPYTQFAKVMRAAGHQAEARKALMERDRLLAIEARLAEYKRPEDGRYLFPLEKPWADAQYVARWAWDSLLRLVAGYGYAPVRSLGALGILFLIAFGVAHMTWSEGQFAPNSDVILVSQGWQDLLAKDCLPKPPTPDCIKNPAETWANDPAHGMDWDSFNALGYAADLVIPILDLGQDSAWAPSKDRGPWGAGLWWGRWVFAALGWLVTALGAAAVTGIIQRNAPD